MSGVDIAGDGQAGIVGRVVLAKEFPDVVKAGGLDVAVRADYVREIRMALRKQLVIQLLFDQSIG